jgi:hypothetical protein
VLPSQNSSEDLRSESRAICRYIALLSCENNSKLMPEHSDTLGLVRFEEAAAIETCYFTPNAWKLCGEILMKP